MTNESPPSYPYRVNGHEASTRDRTPTPGQLLSDAGFEPAEDYVLVQRTAHGTRVPSTDDTVDLKDVLTEFFAFENGVIYGMQLNGHSIFWGAEKIDISQIRYLGNVQPEDDLIWEREDGSGEVLPNTGKFELSKKGVEHLKSRKPSEHRYHYSVDSAKYKTEEEFLTGAQITAQLPQWDPAYSLVLEGEGDEPDQIIQPTTVIHFKGRKGRTHFITVPPATFGAK